MEEAKTVFVLIFLLPDTFDRCVRNTAAAAALSNERKGRGVQSILKSLKAKTPLKIYSVGCVIPRPTCLRPRERPHATYDQFR